MSVLDEIRRATKPMHDELEAGLNIVQRLMCAAERTSMLCTFHALYSAAETALLPQLRLVPDLEYERRLKVPTLLNDLRALGVQPAEGCFKLTARFAALSGPERALGFAYVLEGATLGGRVIRKRVAAAGGSLVGLSFFDFYGPATGDQWKRFCIVLERQCAPHVLEAVDGSRAGFGFMRAALLDRGETVPPTVRVI
jgi:heme oxygenase